MRYLKCLMSSDEPFTLQVIIGRAIHSIFIHILSGQQIIILLYFIELCCCCAVSHDMIGVIMQLYAVIAVMLLVSDTSAVTMKVFNVNRCVVLQLQIKLFFALS